MRSLLPLAAALAMSASAGAQEAPAPATHYIPPDSGLGSDPDSDGAFYEQWFGKHLASMNEPPLWPAAAIDGFRARYRLLVLPSFSQPYAVRIDVRADGSATATYTRTDGRGGYGPGPIAEQRTRPVARGALAAIGRGLAAARFEARTPRSDFSHDEFGAPVTPSDTIVICADGTQFVIEARTSAGDHLVSRHHCELDAPVRALIAAIARAGHMRIPRGDLELVRF